MIEFSAHATTDAPFVTEGTDSCTSCVSRGETMLLVQGPLCGKTPETLLDDYLASSELSVDGLDGSFSLVLIDSARKAIHIYRHIVGSQYVYYAPSPVGFCAGSNLSTVARRSGLTLRPNEAVLPALFLFRIVPGRNTLFDGIFKVMPGERISWTASGGMLRRQLRTMDMFDEPRKTDASETLDRLEAVFENMLADWYDRQPKTAVLLSGGVDSMYIQVFWNKIWADRKNEGRPPSAAVVLDHPYTKADFDYMMSAAGQLGTEHLNVHQSPLSVEQMTELIDRTAEMPNHVQSFYFSTLAEGMHRAGFTAGISGEGADGMFGNDGPDNILSAKRWSRKIPVPILRSLCASLADCLKPNSYTAPILRLANHLYDLDYPRHPQNEAATFTDFNRVEQLFGRKGMLDAMRYRRSILDDVGVPRDSDGLLRAQLIGFFGEGIETAAYWTSMFHLHGVDMFNPFQDSRLIRVASNIRPEDRFVLGTPKQVLKKALARHVPEEFIRRPKLGFGQPIFQWLAHGGALRHAVEEIGDYPWLPPPAKRDILERPPNWFLWTLLCYDLWHKTFFS